MISNDVDKRQEEHGSYSGGLATGEALRRMDLLNIWAQATPARAMPPPTT